MRTPLKREPLSPNSCNDRNSLRYSILREHLMRRIPMYLAKYPIKRVATPTQHRMTKINKAFAFSWAEPQP